MWDAPPVLRKYGHCRYADLVNKLKSVGQLVDLLLTGNIFDILDANKKRLQYS